MREISNYTQEAGFRKVVFRADVEALAEKDQAANVGERSARKTSDHASDGVQAAQRGAPADCDSASERQRHALHLELLARLGMGKPLLARAERLALRNGTEIEDELIVAGHLHEGTYYEALARLLRLPFLSHIDPQRVLQSPSLDALLANPAKPLRLDCPDNRILTVLAPRIIDLAHLVRLFRSNPELRERFAIAPPGAVRAAVWQARALERVAEATDHLSDSNPELSARRVATGWQGFFIGCVFVGALIALLTITRPTLLVTHILLTSLFATCVGLRLFAGFAWWPLSSRGLADQNADELPVYTIMVALYDEAAVVPQIVAAIGDIAWPRSKLDIKFVCEDNDEATIGALRAQRLGPEYEIIRVPRVKPFTKPKALCYAIRGARGDYVVIYDAEDRPHPDQLLEAFALFRSGGERLACIQAPLVIANARRSWLTALFALEYAALFRGLLPFLVRTGLPLPLGGTSNHLRRSALVDVGAWDPFNVTEDADLGLRLARYGYHFGVISRPTLEDAPTRFGDWQAQRSRWFKGWLQTWLVMMRQPGLLTRQLGPLGFVVFQIMTVGTMAAALLSPFMAFFVFDAAVRMILGLGREMETLDIVLFACDLTVVAGTYVAFVVIGYRSLKWRERFHIGGKWTWLPVYWSLMAFAAWNAVWQLMSRPFHWSKTPHEPSRDAMLRKPAKRRGMIASEPRPSLSPPALRP